MKNYIKDILLYLVYVKNDAPKLYDIFKAIYLQLQEIIAEVTTLGNTVSGGGSSTVNNLFFTKDQYGNLLISDEFAGGGVLDTQIGELAWERLEVGVNILNSVANTRFHPGIIEIELDDVTNNYVDLSLRCLDFIQNDIKSLIFLIRIPTNVTNRTISIGLGSAGTDDNLGAESIFFKYDSGTANWIATVRTGSVSTTIDSGVAVAADTWYKLELRNTGGAIQFYINNQLKAGFSTGFSTSAAMNPRYRIKTKANESKLLWIDKFLFESLELGSRI